MTISDDVLVVTLMLLLAAGIVSLASAIGDWWTW